MLYYIRQRQLQEFILAINVSMNIDVMNTLDPRLYKSCRIVPENDIAGNYQDLLRKVDNVEMLMCINNFVMNI